MLMFDHSVRTTSHLSPRTSCATKAIDVLPLYVASTYGTRITQDRERLALCLPGKVLEPRTCRRGIWQRFL